MSPFVIKLESYLRLADIPYKVDFDEPLGPKGKTPWVTINGKDLADSQLVIENLGKEFGRDTSTHLTADQKAIARAFTVMMDEHLIWGLRVWRYDTDKCAGFAECMEGVPAFLKLAMPLYRKKMMNDLWHQGMGRHTFSEVVDIVRKDLTALSNQLGENPYLMDLSNLESYVRRLREQLWPDWGLCLQPPKY
ncbi:failed axon connections homolog [Macrobrachium nipponense]|uniref:failed axon connections homolog n=1 Tax=Macrobrachium nipponense TaxID=159736 RepID=UPI0030C7E384